MENLSRFWFWIVLNLLDEKKTSDVLFLVIRYIFEIINIVSTKKSHGQN